MPCRTPMLSVASAISTVRPFFAFWRSHGFEFRELITKGVFLAFSMPFAWRRVAVVLGGSHEADSTTPWIPKNQGKALGDSKEIPLRFWLCA